MPSYMTMYTRGHEGGMAFDRFTYSDNDESPLEERFELAVSNLVNFAASHKDCPDESTALYLVTEYQKVEGTGYYQQTFNPDNLEIGEVKING